MLTSGIDRFAIAAGCFGVDGFGAEFPEVLTLDKFTAVTLKTTTVNPRPGNPGKILHHEADFSLNAIGLRNPGISPVLSEVLPKWQNQGCLVGLSVWGSTPADYYQLANAAANARIDYVELNLSCVNADTPVLSLDDIAGIAEQCRAPVYAKIGLATTQNPTAADDIKRAVAIARITSLAGLIIGNTISVPTEGLLDLQYGGMSGNQLRPANLRWLEKTAANAAIPIIAVGGIFNARHIQEYREAGAAGYQIGTAMLQTPTWTWQSIVTNRPTDDIYLALDYIYNLRDRASTPEQATAYDKIIADYEQTAAHDSGYKRKELVARAELVAV